MTNALPAQIWLHNVRITFPKIFKGQEEAFDGKGDPYFSASFLLNADHDKAELDAFQKIVQDVATAKWGEKAPGVLAAAKAKDKLPWHDGDLKADKPYGAAYKGKRYVSARNNAKTSAAPTVVDKVIDPKTGFARVIESPNDPRAPYSGCYVNVLLNVFAYEQGGGIGVGASIAGVQFWEDGERLAGGGSASASMFKALPQEAAKAAEATGAGAASLFS